MAETKGPLYDPYRGVKSILPVSTTSDKSLKSILSGLTSLQTSKVGIEALKGKQAKKTKPGLISSVLDPEKGILAMPFRAATALIGEALGFDDDDLRKYNPIESAIRSARGEFAITGGDIFKVNDEDNFLERLPKYVAALGFDVVADPLSYVGGAGVFSRVGGATLMTDKVIATRLLDDAIEIAARKGKSADEVITTLANRRRLRIVGEEVADPKLAASLELGDVVAETFLSKSRGQVLKNLTTAFNDSDIAQDLFLKLPDEVRGGLFLKNPITGRPIVRIAGGRGYTNEGIDALNSWRASLAGSKTGRAVTRNLGGKVLGPGMAAVKYGLIEKNRKALGEFGRTRISDITQLRSALHSRANDIRNIPAGFLKTADTIKQSLDAMDPKQAAEFNQAFEHFFHFRTDITDEVSPEIVKAARSMADELQAQLQEISDKLKEAGVDIGYQKDFKPLKYSDDELERLGRIDPRQGPETRDRYRGDLERKTHTQVVSIEELDAANPIIRTEAMNAVQANEVMGRKAYETDPMKIMTFYMDWAAKTIANARMTKALEATGVLIRFPSETIKLLNIVNAKNYTGAIAKLTPEAVSRAEEAERVLQAELDTLVSAKTVAERERQRVGRINLAEQSYNTAKDQENNVRRQLVEVDRAIKTLEPDVDRIQNTLKKYGNLKLEAVRASIRNLRAKHVSRAARLAKSNAKQMDNVDEARRFVQLLQEQGGEVRIYAPDTQQLEDITISPATKGEVAQAKREVKAAESRGKELAKEIDYEAQSIKEIEDEIAEMTSIIEDTTGTLSAIEVDRFRDYVDALDRKRALTAEYQGLKNNRRVAKNELDSSKRDVMMPRAKGVQTVVEGYMTARRQYLDFAATLRGVPKEKLTAAQADRLKQLKGASKDARWIMTNTLGFVGKGAKQPGRAFAAQIVDLADRLTVQQMGTARVIADSAKLGEFIEKIGYAGTSRTAALGAMGDLMRSYRSIRRYVSRADLDLLNINERAVYEGLAEVPLYEKAERKYTLKLESLNDELRAAHIRGADVDEVEAIEKQIAMVEKLTLDEGFRIVGAGKNVRVPREMKDVYASAGVRDIMERMYRIEQDPTDFEKFIGKIYDPLALLWKTGATVGRGPAYTLTNLLGGLFNNFLGGVGIQEHALAAKVIGTLRSTIAETKAKMPNATDRQLLEAAEDAIRIKLSGIMIGDKNGVEVFEKFLESGAWWTTDTVFQMQELRRSGLLTGRTGIGQREQVLYRFEGEAATTAENSFRRVVNFMLTNPVQTMFNDAAQQSELFLRFAAFTHGYKRFGSTEAAMDMVRMLHFDYQDLSDAELWIKRLVPFYTWTRHNVPLQIRALFLQQDKIRKAVYANAELKKAFGVDDDEQWLDELLPDFIDVNSGFASYIKFGGNHLALFPKLPMQDVDRLLQVTDIGGFPVVMPRIREAGSMLGPAVSPIEFLTGVNFDTGQKFKSNEEMVWQMSRSLIPYIGTAGRIVSAGTIPFTAAGMDLTVGGEGFGAKVINQFVAPEKAQANLFNFLVGVPYGVSTITEKSLTGGLIEEGKAQSAQLKKLADEADVDYEWLRKQIKDGSSVTQLRTKIAMGQGKKAKVEREREARSTGPSRDYVSFIRSIQSGKGTGF
jgi:hypothetical protein